MNIELKGIGESHVLSCEFKQHGIVEKLVDGHILTQTLAPTGLDHKLAGEVSGRLRLQWSQNDALVQRISRYNLPVVKYGQTKGLSLRVRPQIRLEAKRINRRNKSLNQISIVRSIGQNQRDKRK